MKAIVLQVLLSGLLAVAVGCRDRDNGNSGSRADRGVVTRLHQAALKGDLPLVQSLIAGGCDVDARDKDGLLWTKPPLNSGATRLLNC